jgi:enolase-phosphatase E1
VIRALVVDIEGTTTSIAFVKDVLFPYARARLADFVRAHAGDPEVSVELERLRAETGEGTEAALLTLLRYMDEDRKDPVLKDLQGRIWREGYRTGAFVGHVYPDVPPALRRWQRSGLRLYVFSSGSIEAQKLLFAHTEAGDLTALFSGFFDTNTGKKTEPASFRAIAAAIDQPSGQIAFLSDVEAELDAAREAGFFTVWVDRGAGASAGAHPRIQSFDALDPSWASSGV